MLSRGTLRPETARSVIGLATSGLDAARRRGLRHQFLDSNRLFVDPAAGTVTVLGVGVEAASHPGLARSGDQASFQDVHDLCALLFRCISGSAAATFDEGSVPLASSLAHRPVPEDLDLLCALVLGKDEHAPANVHELLAELEPWQSIPVTLEAYDPADPDPDMTHVRLAPVATGSAGSAASAGSAETVPSAEPASADAGAADAETGDAESDDTVAGDAEGTEAAEEMGPATAANSLVQELHLTDARKASAFPGAPPTTPRGETTDAAGPASAEAAGVTEADRAADPEPATPDPSPSTTPSPAPALAPEEPHDPRSAAVLPGKVQPAAEATAHIAPGTTSTSAPDRSAATPDEAPTQATQTASPSGPIIVRGREAARTESGRDHGARSGTLLRDVVQVAMDDEKEDNTYAAAVPPRDLRSRQSQGILLGCAILVIIALVFAVTSITSALRDTTATPTEPTAAATAEETEEPEETTEAESTEPTSEEPSAPAPEMGTLEAFAEGGNGSVDHPEQVERLTDGETNQYWNSKIYQSADYGGLKDGLGIKIPFKETSTLTSVKVTTADNSGGSLELYELKDDGSRGDKLAEGEFAGDGDVTLEPDDPVEVEGVVLWVKELPQDPRGFRARIAEVSVQ
jgi:hypothetical protein